MYLPIHEHYSSVLNKTFRLELWQQQDKPETMSKYVMMILKPILNPVVNHFF